MSKLVTVLLLITLFKPAIAQVVTVDPTFPTLDDEITLIFDVTQATDSRAKGLLGKTSDIYLWSGAGDDNNAFIFEPQGQSDFSLPFEPGTLTSLGNDKWEIKLTPRDYFGVPANTEITRLGLLLKNGNGSAQTEDLFIDISSGELIVKFNSPTQSLIFVDLGENISISAESSEVSDLTLFIDGSKVSEALGATEITYNETISGSRKEVLLVADNGTETAEAGFEYIVRTSTILANRPVDIIDGINHQTDQTKVTLSLLAPFKNSVYVIGAFNNWKIDPAYQLKKDGDHFWIELTGLTPQKEYAFQYLVDETIKIADPFADKILDPDDQGIPSSSYQNLASYPVEGLSNEWYYNRLAVLETGQAGYPWEEVVFQKPAKKDLVIYELLVRDFLGPNANYQSLIDTLSYLKDLGINAIELMPIMEFNGNNSWGYNPTFMFAPDKFYGPKNELKRFIEAAHKQGIAVILDIVLNQNDAPAPYAAMYFDFNNFKPTNQNPWFNVNATHPFNVFNDFNHESNYTQDFVDTVNYYWLNEYRFDGYRFDLSKGFTQTKNTDVNAWSAYDGGRIAILKRMADEIWDHSPDAYVILEHFADNTEEKELSDYGMMLWGNAHFDYKEAILGFGEDRDIGWAYYQNRGWANNYLISYMESHDEQRQMYEALNYGNSNATYNVKHPNTALSRLKMAAAFFLTVPGPKMIWQFGEFGYDVDIEENGRTGIKPTKWEYLNQQPRKKLRDVYKTLIKLRQMEAFQAGTFEWVSQGNLKSIHIDHSSMNVTIIGNFGITEAAIDPGFQSSGHWYDYFSGDQYDIQDPNQPFALAPGEFHIFTDVQLETPGGDLITSLPDQQPQTSVKLFPNPSGAHILISLNNNPPIRYEIKFTDLTGRLVKAYQLETTSNTATEKLNISDLTSGFYIVQITSGASKFSQKIIVDK